MVYKHCQVWLLLPVFSITALVVGVSCKMTISDNEHSVILMKEKQIFIHGPSLDELDERGYYTIRTRTGVKVSADGKENSMQIDLRDITTDRATTPGAQRGGTCRHEYSRDGKRIGFTYDDFLLPDYGRTIGYMEVNKRAPKGSYYFTVLLQPAEKGKSKPGANDRFRESIWLTYDEPQREELVVSPDGDLLAYSIVPDNQETKRGYRQIFTLELEWAKIEPAVKVNKQM